MRDRRVTGGRHAGERVGADAACGVGPGSRPAAREVRAFRGKRFGGFAKVVRVDKGGIVLISSKGRYALRLAVCIAQAGPEAKVSLREVAEREELSLKYLEQIARPMVSAGLLASVRGKGASLAKSASRFAPPRFWDRAFREILSVWFRWMADGRVRTAECRA